jgi:hypothetical protein
MEDVMKSPGSRLSRRNFLLGVSAGSAATAAIVATKSKPGDPDKQTQPAADSKGYHVTDHIRKYYNTAKI